MDRCKKRVLKKIRETSKGQLFTVGTDGFVSISHLVNRNVLPEGKDQRQEDLRYFCSEGYLERGDQNVRITGKGIDALDPWWVQHEGVIFGAIVGGAFALLGTVLGYLLNQWPLYTTK